ncbi:MULTISPECIES: DUF4007 family protein [Flavobacterium]|uniref:Uncharacterized protein DUF4007 n=1 Tax=Flavobacterium cutihirudinis TaxID=1265740 RepID=A0A3D9G349_9FLAO|nr:MULTISPECIES: DUF4007 family protein [Flavobacterium]MBZ4040943.1 DUF4007 family protein [Flavobacterium hibisci]RED27007.1 uncharacterized protein DUF4007 [Flavobacterium cutihirudinis]
MIEEKQTIKFTFSGHDTFHCRHLWLKKGYDFVKNGNKFSQLNAVLELGVGKNMVSAISFWMKAFGLLDNEGHLTELANYIFDDEMGKDPYIEDEGTLWLLHYILVKNDNASIYNLIYNDFRREKIEFSKEHFIAYVSRKIDENNLTQISKNTIASDFEVFVKMYTIPENIKDKEENLTGLLAELNLLHKEKLTFSVINDEKNNIPDEILLFSILDNDDFSNSINLYSLEHEKNQIGSVFAINRAGIVNKIEGIASDINFKKYGITYNDHAGIKELQFRDKPNKYEVLNIYYAK